METTLHKLSSCWRSQSAGLHCKFEGSRKWSLDPSVLISNWVLLVNPGWHWHRPSIHLLPQDLRKGYSSVSRLREHSQDKQWGLLAQYYSYLHTEFLPPCPLHTICFCSPFQQSLFYVLSSVIFKMTEPNHIRSMRAGNKQALSPLTAVAPRLHDWHNLKKHKCRIS